MFGTEVGDQATLAHSEFFCQTTNGNGGQPFAGGDFDRSGYDRLASPLTLSEGSASTAAFVLSSDAEDHLSRQNSTNVRTYLHSSHFAEFLHS
jgi:hypothetical protein